MASLTCGDASVVVFSDVCNVIEVICAVYSRHTKSKLVIPALLGLKGLGLGLGLKIRSSGTFVAIPASPWIHQ